jgi:hypothetical protein
LLSPDPKKRLNFSLIIIEELFKKYKEIPHILPPTVFICPPSEEFKEAFREKFAQ